MKEARKSSVELRASLRFKKFHGDIDSVDYDDLDNYDDNYYFADDDEYRKIGSFRRLFNEFDRDYYKPIRIDDGFGWRRNNDIEYTSRGDRYKHFSPERYLDMIRPYLRDLINYHKPIAKLNNDNGAERWKVQLVMQNNCISVKNFEDTRTIHSTSKPVEIFMGSDTEDVMDRLFDTTLGRFQQAIKTSNENGSGFTEVLNYYIIIL